MDIQEELTKELQFFRKRVEQTAQNIDQISRNLSAEQHTLQNLVREYAAKRVDLFKQALAARGMTWCTCCSKIISEADAELLFEEGRHSYSHGYGNSFYGFRGFSKLHRACPACRQKAADRHGWKGEYDSQCNDQACYNAFQVEKRDDGYYARKFGDWVKLDADICKFDDPPKDLVEKSAEEWNLPPRITLELERGSFSDRNLVIHERATKTEAA